MIRTYRTRVLATALLTIGGLATVAWSQVTNCRKNQTPRVSACDHYVDLSPGCPDVLLGGGDCGDPEHATNGLRDANTSNPSCQVIFKAPNSEGQCVTVGQDQAIVTCTEAGGPVCPPGSPGG